MSFPDDRAADTLTQYMLLGKQTEERSAGANDSGNAVVLTASGTVSAFAVYRFKPLAAPDNVQVSLGDATTVAWIGLADFARQRWSLSGPYTSSHVFNLAAGNYVSPNGNIYIAVIAPAGAGVVVDQLQLYAQNIPPTAGFTATPPSGGAPLSVNFDAASSTDADGTVARYEWDFDSDGVYELDRAGLSDAQHVFATVGTQHVSLRVTDSSGDQDTHSTDILIEHAPPVGNFTVSAQQLINPLKLNYIFDASASSDPEGGALTYDWDFDGDGNWDVLAGQAIENHSYPNIGVYAAKLRVTNPVLLSATASQTVYCPSVWSSFRGPPGCTTRQSPIIGAQTNHVKWTFTTGSNIDSSPAIGPDGTIYICSDGSKVYALTDNGTATPTVKWNYTTGNVVTSSPAVGPDGTVYVSSQDNKVYALVDNGTATPTVKWSYPIGGGFSSPCIGPNGTLYIGGNDHHVYALVDNGTPTPSVRWSYLTGNYISSSPCIGPDGTVYIGSNDNVIYALANNGTPVPTLKWSFTTGEFVFSSPAVGHDGTVYVGSQDHTVYALVDNGTSTPTVKWSYATGDFLESSPAVGPDGTVYIGSADGNLYALADNGTATPTVKWHYAPFFQVLASPTLGQDGTVYVCFGPFYALADNGTATPTVKWSYPTNGAYGSAAIGPDGTVYVGCSGDNTLYAFGP